MYICVCVCVLRECMHMSFIYREVAMRRTMLTLCHQRPTDNHITSHRSAKGSRREGGSVHVLQLSSQKAEQVGESAGSRTHAHMGRRRHTYIHTYIHIYIYVRVFVGKSVVCVRRRRSFLPVCASRCWWSTQSLRAGQADSCSMTSALSRRERHMYALYVL